jgi:hypothetical protein
MGAPPAFTKEITAEIERAIRTLGGDPDTLDLTDTWQVNRTLEFLGADVYIMATIGSWRDTLTDEEIAGRPEAVQRRGITRAGRVLRGARQITLARPKGVSEGAHCEVFQLK